MEGFNTCTRIDNENAPKQMAGIALTLTEITETEAHFSGSDGHDYSIMRSASLDTHRLVRWPSLQEKHEHLERFIGFLCEKLGVAEEDIEAEILALECAMDIADARKVLGLSGNTDEDAG